MIGRQIALGLALGSLAGAAVGLTERELVAVGIFGPLLRGGLICFMGEWALGRWAIPTPQGARWVGLLAGLTAEYSGWAIHLGTYHQNDPGRFRALSMLERMGGDTAQFGVTGRAFLAGGFGPLAVLGFIDDCATKALSLASPLVNVSLSGAEVWAFAVASAVGVAAWAGHCFARSQLGAPR